MKKKMILISFIGLLFLIFPLIAAADLLELTSGTPVSQAVDISYDVDNWLSLDDDEAIIHGYTFQALNNGYYRFSLDYTMPAGLEVYISYSLDDDPVRTKVADTVSSRNLLQFDMEKNVLDSAGTFYVDFYSPDEYDSFSVYFDSYRLLYPIILTSGMPVGEAVDICFYVNNELSENQNEAVIHSYTYQELNNEYYRFSLDYTMPAGLHVYIFDPPNGDVIGMWGTDTVSSRNTLQFDIEKNTLLSIEGITINFYEEEGEGRFFVFFNAGDTFGFLLYPIIMTSGTPVGEVIDMPFYVESNLSLNDNETVVHSYTYQELNNGYYRFSLDYTMPAGLGVHIYPPQDGIYAPQGDFKMLGPNTVSSRSTLQFDIEKSTLLSVVAIHVSFTGRNGSFTAAFRTGTLFHPIMLTSGTPVGESIDVPFIAWNYGLSLNDNETVIHSYKYQELDNGYYRFSLDYTLPVGLVAYVYDPPNGDTVSLYGPNTVSSRNILQFDISKNTLTSVEYINVSFHDFSKEYLVEIERDSVLPQPVHFDLSDGIPVGNAREINYRASDGITVHSYFCQQLNNGKTRFTLSFTAPAGFHMSIFNLPDAAVFFRVATGVTGSGKTTVQFDLNDGDLLSIDEFYVHLFHSFDDESYNIMHNIDNDYFLDELSTLWLPDSLTSVSSYAFSGLACQAVIIPDGCTSIGDHAFAGCADLLYVRIPSTVEDYPESAFADCNENLVIDWEKE